MFIESIEIPPLDASSPHQTKKIIKSCHGWTPSDKTFWIRAWYMQYINDGKMIKKIVSMIRKYRNHTLQTKQRHRKEEPPQDIRKTTKAVFLKTRKDTKKCKTKQRPTTEPPQTKVGTNNNRTTALERTAA